MKNTQTENKKRMFIVSFGNGRRYKVEYTPKAGDREDAALRPLVAYEKELNEYLAQRFPGDTFAYYTTPRITEVNAAQAERYSAYAPLDAKAKADIKRQLTREVEVMNTERTLDNNDGWGNIGATPATDDE